MATTREPDESASARDAELAEQIVARAWDEQRTRAGARRDQLPGWTLLALRLLPWATLTVTIVNGLLGLVAFVSPWVERAFGARATAPLWWLYAFICPQRPSHTWFIDGIPMVMEQRMVVMYLAAGAAGALYHLRPRFRRPLASWLALLLVAPVLLDVGISTIGLRPSTELSRLWTGLLAAPAVVWWAYPRFDGELRRVLIHLGMAAGEARVSVAPHSAVSAASTLPGSDR